MAKVKLGQMVAQASGSVGGTVFSHNRFGAYIRNRSIPVQPESGYQLARRNDLATASAEWSLKLAPIRKAWKVWAENNPITDSLGDQRILDGHQAYTMLATRLFGQGFALPTTPPVSPTPNGLTSCTITASAASQTCSMVFLPNPLAATYHLWIVAAKTPTGAVNYIKNLLRFIGIAEAASASPCTGTAIADRLGTLTIGEQIVARLAVFSQTTGLLSVSLECRCTVGA